MKRLMPLAHVAITLRGFDLSRAELKGLLARERATDVGLFPGLARPGAAVLLGESLLSYHFSVPKTVPLYTILPDLWQQLGGYDQVVRLRHLINPQSLAVHFMLPVKYSLEQDTEWIDSESILQLSELGAGLRVTMTRYP